MPSKKAGSAAGIGPMGRVAGIVLAAGASRRMGESVNKLLLDVDGEAMVRRTTRRVLEAGLSTVIVVLGHERARVRAALAGLGCEFAVSADPNGPTSASLHAGLRALGPDAPSTIVMLGDMVHVTSDMVRAVVTAADGTLAPLVVSRYGEDLVPAPPLLFRRALWPELLAWHGEGCGRAVVQAHRDEALWLDWPADLLRDVDTPADYEELIR